jgi:hypothetical protein
MTGTRLLARALLLLSLAVVALVGWAVLFGDPRLSVALLAGDDAGYYLAIARNACLGFGMSFDRVHPTNGFNPLETLLLVAADRVFAPGLGLVPVYRVGLMLSLVALIVGLIALVRLAHAWLDPERFGVDGRRLLVAASVAFYCLFIVPKKQFGMDAALVVAIGCVWLARVARRGLLAPGARSAVTDGILLGLLVLARVDNVPFLTAAFAAMAVLAAAGGARERAGFAGRAAACAVTIAPFVVWGYRKFGTWMPVSARIKSSFPHPDLAASLDVIRHSSVNAADQAGFLLAFVVAWVLVARAVRAALTGGLSGFLHDPKEGIRTVLALYLVQRFGFMLLFSRTDVQGGYVMLAHVFNLIALWSVIEWVARRRLAPGPRAAAVAAALLALVSVGLVAGKAAGLRARIADPASGNELTLAGRIGAATRPGDVLYGGAFGLVGYFADRAWINGDGVANTEDYQRAIADGDLRGWLRRSGVTHVVFASADSGFASRREPLALIVPSAIHGRRDSILVDPREVVLRGWLARGLTRGAGGSSVYLVRWRS